MHFEIKHRWTGATLFNCELSAEIAGKSLAIQLGFAVKLAVAGDANLCGANLCDANLREANLREANLCGANLCGANLREANLCDANLCGANLRGANLCEANLCGANLCGANLCDANLCGANLREANLCDANLCDANLCEANLCGANLCGANLREANLCDANLCDANLCDAKGISAPVIPNIDDTILAAIQSPGNALRMAEWHTCDTTHCRAGWAVFLAGQGGKTLEDRIGTGAAGALIYHASAGYIPDFYATNEVAMDDIKAHAITQRGEA